jgi:hypothetical protein
MILSVSILVLLHLIQLHGPDGQIIDVNPNEVSSLREPREGSEGHFPNGTKCIISMTNSKLVFVTEDCELIRMEIEGMK